MAQTANCVACGRKSMMHGGHVTFYTKDGRRHDILAGWCHYHRISNQRDVQAGRTLSKKSNSPGYQGDWIARDGLSGMFRRPGRGKFYPASEELL